MVDVWFLLVCSWLMAHGQESSEDAQAWAGAAHLARPWAMSVRPWAVKHRAPSIEHRAERQASNIGSHQFHVLLEHWFDDLRRCVFTQTLFQKAHHIKWSIYSEPGSTNTSSRVSSNVSSDISVVSGNGKSTNRLLGKSNIFLVGRSWGHRALPQTSVGKVFERSRVVWLAGVWKSFLVSWFEGFLVSKIK